jgi:ABC-type phosphate/phosphonate transport system substrate-binding protein
MELEDGVDGAAVISSTRGHFWKVAARFKKVTCAVLAESQPVPFVTAFVNEALPEETRRSIEQALLDVAKQKELLSALETRDGFVPYRSEAAAKKRTENLGTESERYLAAVARS